MNKKKSPLYVVALIFSIIWILTIIVSVLFSIIYGLIIANIPTLYGYYTVLEGVFDGSFETGNWVSLIASMVFMPILVPFITFIFCFTFPPIGIVLAIIEGICYFAGFVVGGISIVASIISFSFALATLIISAKGLNDKAKRKGFYITCMVFAILSFVSLLVAGVPLMFSLASLLRYLCIVLVGVLLIVASVKGLKQLKQEQI